MRRSPHPRVDLEIAVVRLCHRPRAELIETVLERLEQAEARLRGYGGPALAAGPVQSDLLGAPPEPALPRPVAVPRPVERGPGAAPARQREPRAGPAGPRGAGPGARAEPAARAPERGRDLVGHRRRGHPRPADTRAPPVRRGGRRGGGRAHHRLGAERQRVRARPDQAAGEPGARPRDGPAGPARAPGRRVHRRGAAPGGVPAGTHPVVQAAMELFEGEIIQVRAAPGPRASAPAEPAASGGEAP